MAASQQPIFHIYFLPDTTFSHEEALYYESIIARFRQHYSLMHSEDAPANFALWKTSLEDMDAIYNILPGQTKADMQARCRRLRQYIAETRDRNGNEKPMPQKIADALRMGHSLQITRVNFA